MFQKHVSQFCLSLFYCAWCTHGLRSRKCGTAWGFGRTGCYLLTAQVVVAGIVHGVSSLLGLPHGKTPVQLAQALW